MTQPMDPAMLQSVTLAELDAGSLFIWNGRLYSVNSGRPDVDDKIQVTEIASYWTSNPDDRWIVASKPRYEQFWPDCKVWQLKHNPRNP